MLSTLGLFAFIKGVCVLYSIIRLETFMIAILYRALGIAILIPLIGCGVRGPLYLPNIPPAPTAPTESEPKGKLYPPQTSTAPASNNTSSSAK